MSEGKNSEGEAHDEIVAPKGSIFTGLHVGGDGDQVAAYWSDDPNNSSATHAYIMIHGRLRDGDKYWTTMNDILQSAIDDNVPGADEHAIVVAPQFFSTKYNSGQYGKHVLAWGDVNAWQAGEVATHPKGTQQTSFDALDALVNEFMDASKYPDMKNVTVVGHGGGGQLNQRYAMMAEPAANSAVHIRYIHGDASSSAYFTNNRPKSISDASKALPKRADCPWYNTWRYGFDNFTGTANGLKTPEQYFQQYITRDVISIVGYQDTKASGDTYCMAEMQGGTKRRDRNLAYWQYVNTLARTNEDLDGFPATFDTLPDWSQISNNLITMRLVVVADAAHNAEEVFAGKEGRSALFFKEVERGWRPKGWKPAQPVVRTSNHPSSVTASNATHPLSTNSLATSSSGDQALQDNVSGAPSLPGQALTIVFATFIASLTSIILVQ